MSEIIKNGVGIEFVGGKGNWTTQIDGNAPLGSADLLGARDIIFEDYQAGTAVGKPSRMSPLDRRTLADVSAKMPPGNKGPAAIFTKGCLTPRGHR